MKTFLFIFAAAIGTSAIAQQYEISKTEPDGTKVTVVGKTRSDVECEKIKTRWMSLERMQPNETWSTERITAELRIAATTYNRDCVKRKITETKEKTTYKNMK